jgi:hypothetical protein
LGRSLEQPLNPTITEINNTAETADRQTVRSKSICRKKEKMTEKLPTPTHITLPILTAMRGNSLKPTCQFNDP